MSPATEDQRQQRLRDAEATAGALFDEVVARGLIAPGKSERELSDEVRDLARDLYGVRRFWHKRIVRAGAHTLEPYRANPPDRVIEDDDIVFLDFGPLLEEWEADFGRTYVLGGNRHKARLARDLPVLWSAGKQHFDTHHDITGSQLFDHVVGLIRAAGWEHTAGHTGHLVGEFPHERINGDELDCYIAAGNDLPMRRADAAGHPCHWILEIHAVSPDLGFGGFHEQLLDL